MGTGWRRAFCTSIRRDPAGTTPTSLSSSSIAEHKHQQRQQQQQQQQKSPSPKNRSSRRGYVKLGIGGIFSSGSGGGGGGGGGGGESSNPSTPPLQSNSSNPRCGDTSSPPNFEIPRVLECKTTTTTKLPSAAAATATTPTPSSLSSSIKSNNSKGSLSPRLFGSSSPRSPSGFALLKTALCLSRNRCGICGESVRTSGDQRTAVFTAECSHAFHFPCISSLVRSQGSLVCPVCSATWHQVPLLSSFLHSPSTAAAGQFHGTSCSSAKLEERCSNSRRSGQHREGERERAAASSGNAKIYDDDESLQLSPGNRFGVGVLQFNPIPEELEAEDYDNDEDVDEDREAQDDCSQGRYGDRNHQIISVVPDSLALVSTGRNHLIYVVSIRVKAPCLPSRPQAAATAAASVKKHVTAASMAIPPSLLDHPSSRAPIDLVTVLDVSGSMSVAKLQMLKRAMRLVISSLGPGDRLSIVAFSMAAAKRLFPLRRMSRPSQQSARQIVDRLVICGSSHVRAQGQDQSRQCLSKSCMGDALRKATKVLEDRRERNPVATIMLLSDGHRHGHSQEQQPLEQNVCGTCTTSSSRSHSQQPSSATRFTHIEIPIHASADTKQGRSLENNNVPVVEENAYAKHVNGLVSMVLQDVHLQFSFPCESGVISSVYSYPQGGECGDIHGIGQAMSHGEGGRSVILGDLYADEERQLLLELKVPKVTVLGGHAMSVSLKCSYMDPLTQEVINCGERPLSLPMPMPLCSQEFPILLHYSSSSSSRAGATSMTTQQQQQLQLRNIFVTARAMAESRRLVELSELDTALHLLSSARTFLHQQSTAVTSTHKKLVLSLEAQLEDLQKQQQEQRRGQRWQPQRRALSPSQRRRSEELALLGESGGGGGGGGGEPLTPTSAWRAAEQLAKVAIMRKSLNRVSDLHGLENARF